MLSRIGRAMPESQHNCPHLRTIYEKKSDEYLKKDLQIIIFICRYSGTPVLEQLKSLSPVYYVYGYHNIH
jgi:hypothetical protein